jgi:hypothetical protein
LTAKINDSPPKILSALIQITLGLFLRQYVKKKLTRLSNILMTILNETARLVKDKLASECEALTVERVMIGMFFSGVKLSNGFAGISYTPVKDVPQAVCCPDVC